MSHRTGDCDGGCWGFIAAVVLVVAVLLMIERADRRGAELRERIIALERAQGIEPSPWGSFIWAREIKADEEQSR